jgi:hypothetical protein
MALSSIDLSDLRSQEAVLADKVEALLKEADEQGATEGPQRLALVSKLFGKLTVDDAYQLINPDAFLDEVSASWISKSNIKKWQLARSILSLLPLILTWIGLFLASSAYQQYGVNHPGDLSQPFLQLWQNGFYGIKVFGFIPVPTFAGVAILDFLVLSCLLICMLRIQHLENRAQTISAHFGQKLLGITEQLVALVSRTGITSILKDDDIDRIGEAVSRAVTKTMAQSDKVALQAKQFIEASEQRVNATLTQFEGDLNLFNADLTQLTSNLSNFSVDLQNHNQQVKDLTDASTLLAGSSQSLASLTQNIAANTNQGSQASQNINVRLAELNATQQQLLQEISTTQQQVVQEIATTQQQVVAQIDATQQHVVDQIAVNQQHVANQIDSAAQTMKGVAGDTKAVAKELGQITKADLQAMTNQVTHAADQVTAIAGGLAGIEKALQNAATAIENAATALANSRIAANQAPKLRLPFSPQQQPAVLPGVNVPLPAPINQPPAIIQNPAVWQSQAAQSPSQSAQSSQPAGVQIPPTSRSRPAPVPQSPPPTPQPVHAPAPAQQASQLQPIVLVQQHQVSPPPPLPPQPLSGQRVNPFKRLFGRKGP